MKMPVFFEDANIHYPWGYYKPPIYTHLVPDRNTGPNVDLFYNDSNPVVTFSSRPLKR